MTGSYSSRHVIEADVSAMDGGVKSICTVHLTVSFFFTQIAKSHLNPHVDCTFFNYDTSHLCSILNRGIYLIF